MRKPRDFDAELAALEQKTRTLRQRKIMQLGELVIATSADEPPIDVLAGALLAAAVTKDTATREAWRKAGAAMFQGKTEASGSARPNQPGAASGNGTTEPPDGKTGAG